MLKFFSKIFFILMFLVSNFFTVHDIEAKSKVKLSKKYIPPGNPGGANFHADKEFADSYKLYEKRREILKKKKLQDQSSSNVNKEDLIKKLKEKKIASLDNEPNDVGACMVDNEEDAMINQHGINLTRLKGAVFIDQDPLSQYENKQHKSEQQKGKKVREKKISPINVTIKETPSRRTCSHDSITDLNRTPQHSLNGSSSFGSVADVVK